MGLNGQDYTQLVGSGAGLRNQYAVTLPPGARVAAYVRSTGLQNGDDTFIAQNLVSTLAAGLTRARANMGDYVICLPGHVENVADATTFSAALVAGTKIIGVGRGGNTPTFQWTATTASWLVAVNDVAISGLRLLLAGVVGALSNTTLPISVTGNDFGLFACEIETGNASANSVTAIACSGTSSRFDVSGNSFRSVVNAVTSTTVLVSSTGSNGRICDNEMLCAANINTGNINVTGAHTGLRILRNTINNTTGTSVAAIVFSNVAVTGSCSYNNITVLSTGAVSLGVTGITVGGTNNLTGFFQNFVVNDPNKSGFLAPAVDT